ncbi:MAG: cbb3-type cytochrome oxidase assembly protein CcoS [Phycisphaerales bacterium]
MMSALFMLIPLAMVFVFVAIGAFIWAARSGQFDDMDTPRVRVLFDDEDDAAAPSADRAADAESRAE